MAEIKSCRKNNWVALKNGKGYYCATNQSHCCCSESSSHATLIVNNFKSISQKFA